MASVLATHGEKHAGLATRDTHDKLYEFTQSSQIPELDAIQLYIEIFVNNQLDAQFFFMYVYFYPLHVSGTCPDRPWGPPTLLYNGYRVFPGGKERPVRDADPSSPSSAVVMKE